MKNLEYYLSLNYHKTVTQDDEGDYIVEVQELPGCIADGETPNEAFDNLREAMTSWLESRMEAGLDVPEPRPNEDYSGKVLLRMPKFLHRRLAEQSEIEGISLNQYIVSLLSDGSARLSGSVTTRPTIDAEYVDVDEPVAMRSNATESASPDVWSSVSNRSLRVLYTSHHGQFPAVMNYFSLAKASFPGQCFSPTPRSAPSIPNPKLNEA